MRYSHTRRQQSYDHCLRDIVRTTGDPDILAELGVPRYTVLGWLHTDYVPVVTADVLDMDHSRLQAEVLRLPPTKPHARRCHPTARPILFGEASLRRALRQFSAHYQGKRKHQGKNNVLRLSSVPAREARIDASVACPERFGGILEYCHREAA